jgi:hypothetical protein
VDVVVFEDELPQPASKPTMQAGAHAAAGRKTRRCRPHGGGIFNNGSRLVGAGAGRNVRDNTPDDIFTI